MVRSYNELWPTSWIVQSMQAQSKEGLKARSTHITPANGVAITVGMCNLYWQFLCSQRNVFQRRFFETHETLSFLSMTSFIYWKFALEHDFRSREDIYVIAEKLERNDFSLGILFDKKNVILTSFQLEIRVRISNYIWLWKWKEGAVQPSKTSASFEAHATMNQNHLQCISLSILAQCNWLSNWLHLNNSFRTLV